MYTMAQITKILRLTMLNFIIPEPICIIFRAFECHFLLCTLYICDVNALYSCETYWLVLRCRCDLSGHLCLLMFHCVVVQIVFTRPMCLDAALSSDIPRSSSKQTIVSTDDRFLLSAQKSNDVRQQIP